MTLAFDGNLFDKLTFDPWHKERMTHSLHGKTAADEGHERSIRPWEAFSTMLATANLHSETKEGMAQIGISLHATKSKECYSVQFVCNACGRSIDIMFGVADDRSLRDRADKTVLKVFAPYFQLIGTPYQLRHHLRPGRQWDTCRPSLHHRCRHNDSDMSAQTHGCHVLHS